MSCRQEVPEGVAQWQGEEGRRDGCQPSEQSGFRFCFFSLPTLSSCFGLAGCWFSSAIYSVEAKIITHQSTITLKPLRGKVTEIHLLVTIKCSSGQTLGSGIHVNAILTPHSHKHCCSTHALMALALPQGSGPPSRTMLPATPQKLLRNRPRNVPES